MKDPAQIFAAVMTWLNDPLVKYVGLLVGGIFWKKHPDTVNRAAAFLLGLASALVTIVHWLLPDYQPATAPAVYEVAGVFSRGSLLSSLFYTAIIPWLLAVGSQSATKNTAQWIQDGGGLVKKPVVPPR